MKTVIFVLMIIASVCYLAVGDNSAVSNWLGQQSPGNQIDKISESLNTHVNKQLTAFKSEVEQKQQQQIESLQTSLVNMAQKLAKLESKYSQLVTQVAEQKQPAVVSQPPPSVTELVEHQVNDDQPDVGIVPRPQSLAGEALADVVTQPSDGPVDVAVVQVNAQADELNPVNEPQLMDVRQRRKRLQSLTERMTLKSLGVER